MQEAFIDMNHRVKSLECEVERLKRIMDSLVAEWTSPLWPVPAEPQRHYHCPERPKLPLSPLPDSPSSPSSPASPPAKQPEPDYPYWTDTGPAWRRCTSESWKIPMAEAGQLTVVPDYSSVPPQKTTLCSVRFTESHEGGAFEFGTCGHGEAQAGKEPADGLQE